MRRVGVLIATTVLLVILGVARPPGDEVITVKIEGSTFANLIGRADQKRIITSITADELKFTNPATPSGETLQLVWKRAK